jgi:hypothetical protein
MKSLFFMGGPLFMGILTLLLVITAGWIIYHLIIGYNSNQINREKLFRNIEYGKSMGLFAMVVGILGQMNGLYAMFAAIEAAIRNGEEVIPALVFGGIKVTMIVTIYGMLIYLLSLVLWFAARTIIERKLEKE